MKRKLIIVSLAFILIISFAFIIFGGKKEKIITYNCDGRDQALEYFYEDVDYKYYFSTTGNYVQVNNTRYSFKQAINDKIISINDVICEYFKEAKFYLVIEQTEIVKDLFYHDDVYNYYLTSSKAINTYIVFNSGLKINIKDALNQNKIKINEILPKLDYVKEENYGVYIENTNDGLVNIENNIYTYNVKIETELKLSEALNTLYTKGEEITDGNNIIYKFNDFSILKCLDGKTIIGKDIDNTICSENKIGKQFIRTYNIIDIIDKIDYFEITIKSFDNEPQVVKVNKNIALELQKNSTYEFTFKILNNSIIDIEKSIFENSEIINVKKTDKIDSEQINESF